ncbi:hypothetical protein ACPJXG_12360 [Janthinobacterium sp. NFX145]|uniref:hypothetical protein n=1 Tax=Janthinobacterium sp. NFX145 TaxID=3415602 RepID=UPI003CC64D85
MTAEFKQHFVAFLDILGFKQMVAHDISHDSVDYLMKLYKCHQGAANIFHDDPTCTITQFSDSIVISKPYDAKGFTGFATHVAEYQRLLLDEELLCRGGIAVNKHFSINSFTFSAGLIAAYDVESTTARYPRVVISTEVIALVYPDGIGNPNFLIKEDDGLWFIDYIGITSKIRPKKLKSSVENIVSELEHSNSSSVREKGLWLASYADATLKTTLKKPKFSGAKIK